MAETTCLCHTISLLSVLLISDIGLISGIAHALSTEPNDSRTIHEDGLLAYALLALSLIALGLMIAILMLASLLIKTMKNILSPNTNLPDLPEQKYPWLGTNRIRRRHSSHCLDFQGKRRLKVIYPLQILCTLSNSYLYPIHCNIHMTSKDMSNIKIVFVINAT